MQYFSDISNICSGIKLRMVQFIVMLNHLNKYNVVRCTLIKDGKLVFQIQIFLYRIVYTGTWNTNYILYTKYKSTCKYM